MTQVKSLIREQSGLTLEAKIMKSASDYFYVDYYVNGNFMQSETFKGHSMFYVEDAAENWFEGIKVLNG